MKVYGTSFASIYNEKWSFWGPHVWPFLFKQVTGLNQDARSWLDLCCGTGSLLKLVADHGFESVGIDISPYQLTYARKNVPGATFIRQDIRNLDVPHTVDVVSCMFDSLNYLTRKEDLYRVFRNVRKLLNPGGLFMFDMNTFEGLQDKWCQTSTIRDPHYMVIIETSFNSKQGRGKCLITGFIKEGKGYRKFEEAHIERGYRSSEIEGLLKKSGFRFKKYDGCSFKKPGKRCPRLLYVCQ